MGFERDPVSVLFDAGARRLLERAYARPGAWVGMRLTGPAPAHRAYLASIGVDPDGPDDKTGNGNLNARTRWARGLVRALYYQHRWWSGSPDTGGWRSRPRAAPRAAGGLEVEIGRVLPGGRQAGTVLAPGRAVRVRYHPTGTRAHVRASSAPAYTLDPGAQSDPEARTW